MLMRTSAPVPLKWKAGLLAPLGAALSCLVMAAIQADRHAKLELTVIGNLLVAASIAAQGVYWIAVRRMIRMGLFSVILGSALFGFGLHTLLRVLEAR